MTGRLKIYNSGTASWDSVGDGLGGPSTVSITSNEVPTGLVNSSNVDFTTAAGYVSGSLQVYINGLRQALTTHFTETTPASGTFAMGDAPTTGDIITVSYQTAASATGNADTLDNFHATSFYPVGTIYSNKTNSANPSTYLPGQAAATWVAIQGYVIAGYKSGDANFGTAGATVGVASVKLTAAESGLPAHLHEVYANSGGSGYGFAASANYRATSVSTSNVTAANASSAHTNIQPTLVAYTWERTA